MELVFLFSLKKSSQQKEAISNTARGTLNQNNNSSIKILKSYKLQDLKLIRQTSDEVKCDIMSCFPKECESHSVHGICLVDEMPQGHSLLQQSNMRVFKIGKMKKRNYIQILSVILSHIVLLDKMSNF